MTEPLVPFTTIYGSTAMVASADHLASQAGLATLAAGGSAVDAAIATNAVLAVTGPHMCGMGGDLFALVHDGGTAPVALDASGRAGSGADPDRLRAEGHVTMPRVRDPRSITVPGCVDGWVALHERYGRLALADIFAPAIGYAENGFPASPLLVASVAALAAPPTAAPAARQLAEQARRPGDRAARPGVGRALRAIAGHGREAFYGGEFGAGLVAVGAGEFSDGDLAVPLAAWVPPLSLAAWDHVLWTIPPGSQGYLTLAAAWIAAGLSLPDDPDDPAWAHLLVESAIAAGHDRPAVLAEHADGAALLSPQRLSPRRDAIRADAAGPWSAPAGGGDTTYLCVVDSDGMGVSLIQSNASGFGSGLFEPSTGINLHNRGLGFCLTPGHPAEYGPGRRPPHTLAPLLLTRPGGALAAVVGTQGGDAQPQILLQVAARLLQVGQRPAPAIGAARWILGGSGQGFDTWTATSRSVVIEDRAPEAWVTGLTARGHHVVVRPAFEHQFGHAHVITINEHGIRAGAADPRARVSAVAAR
jgi:gamma-glutamyltranspeptidase/glutathione hydrolase